MNDFWFKIWGGVRKLINSYLFSTILLLIFVAGYWVVRSEIYSLNNERLQHKFEVESKTVVVNMEDYLKEYSDLLHTMRGLIMASEEVTRQEWKNYTDNLKLAEEYPSVYALEWVRRVPSTELTSFETKVHADLAKAKITDRVFKVTPSGERNEYYVIDYLEPYENNKESWGYDLYSEAVRRKAIDLARDTNEVIISEPLVLVQEKKEQKGILLMLPVYKKGVNLDTLQSRRDNVEGLVIVAVRVPDLLTAVLTKETFTSLGGVVLSDLSSGVEEIGSMRVGGGVDEIEKIPEVYKERLTYGARVWELSFRSEKKAEVVGIDLLIPYLLLFVGFLATLFQRWRVRSVQKSEERLEHVISSSKAGTWEWNVKSGELIVNDRWAELLGYTKKELEPISIKTWEKLTLPDDLAKAQGLLSNYFAGKIDKYELEAKMRHKDGSVVWVYDRGALISRDFKGKPLKMIGIHLDITARKEAEERLRRSREDILNLSRRNEAVLYSIGDGVLACDREGRVVVFNKMAEQLTGFSRNEVGGKHYSTVAVFIEEKTGKPLHDLVLEAINKGLPVSVSGDTAFKKTDGSLVPVAVSAAPVKDANNVIMGCVVVFKDMTLQRSMDKAKTEFVMEASHHLRTPLSAINWYTQFLQDEKNGVLTQEQLGLVGEIRKAGARMTDLTNSLLNVARLEMGTFSVEPFLVKLSEVVSQSVDLFRPEIQKKGLVFTEQYEVGEEMFLADPKMLGLVVQNILGNAVSYTPNGGSVSLVVKAEDGEIKIIISDTGIGIAAIDQGRVYEKFYRGDNVKQINPSGMGLGLYIVKEIVEQSGGHVSFLSEEGKGTTFWVTYPKSGMRSVNGNQKQST